jgi:hypothetical protein
MLKYSICLMGALGCAVNAYAVGSPLDDLKGYSIDLQASVDFAFNDPQASKGYPSAGTVDVHHRIYISVAGNIFDYADTDYRSGNTEHAGGVAAPEKVTEQSRGRLQVWTVGANNQLTSIIKEIEGFHVATITVDANKSNCTFVQVLQPDPTTHRVMRMRIHGYLAELVSESVRSYTCRVTRGNIFAADQ